MKNAAVKKATWTSPTSENEEVPLLAIDNLHFLALYAVFQMLHGVGG